MPNIEIYGVLGVQAGLDADGYRLDELAVQQAVADFSAQAVETLGIDGVLLNVDLVSNGDTNYLDLLRGIRRSLPPDAKLAIATPPDWTPRGVDIPRPTLIAEGAAWDEEYKQRVALIQVDQMVVQAYNSYLEDPADYTEWVAYQTQAFAEAMFVIQAPTDILIGVPTYDNTPPAHNVRVEMCALHWPAFNRAWFRPDPRPIAFRASQFMRTGRCQRLNGHNSTKIGSRVNKCPA